MMQYVPWLFLAFQAVIVLASLLGYGIFTARPDLLAKVDPEARFFIWAFSGFAIFNMALGGLAVVAESLLRNRLRIVLALSAVYIISLISELLGTTYGIPFGAYEYTELLGPKWFGKVPLVIPFSWVTLTWAVWVLTRQRKSTWLAVALGAILLVAWDLLLDPAMSRITSYWVWGQEGSYYGMPWSNLAGWGITGLVLLAVLAKVAPSPQGSVRFAQSVYVVNCALPLGFCLFNGYWIAVAAGTGSAIIAYALAVAGGSLPEENPAEVPDKTEPYAVGRTTQG